MAPMLATSRLHVETTSCGSSHPTSGCMMSASGGALRMRRSRHSAAFLRTTGRVAPLACEGRAAAWHDCCCHARGKPTTHDMTEQPCQLGMCVPTLPHQHIHHVRRQQLAELRATDCTQGVQNAHSEGWGDQYMLLARGSTHVPTE